MVTRTFYMVAGTKTLSGSEPARRGTGRIADSRGTNVAQCSGARRGTGAGDRQRTLSELWQGIMLESRVGRSRGAVAVRVVVDGDPDIAALFAATNDVKKTAVPSGFPGPGDGGSRGPVAAP